MAYEPNKWVLGLLPTALLWLAGTWIESGPIRRDLSARSTEAIGTQLLDAPGIKVGGRDVSLSGSAFTPALAARAVAAVQALPGVRLVNSAGLTLVPEVKPFVWSASYDGRKLALTGSVPDPATRTALLAAGTSIKNVSLSDATIYGRGNAGGLASGGSYALGLLAQFIQGTATITDGALSLSGTVRDATTYQALMAALKTLPAGLTLGKIEITPPAAPISGKLSLPTPAEMTAAAEAAGPLEAALCQDNFKDRLTSARIEFETGSAEVRDDSYALLKELALIALRCKTGQIEISGHTDSQGSDDTNLKLSKDRADSVFEVMKRLGVPTDKLTTAGFGASKPIAPNDTAEGRAQNRRIEFSVKG